MGLIIGKIMLILILLYPIRIKIEICFFEIKNRFHFEN
jgi:hypothetical protein